MHTHTHTPCTVRAREKRRKPKRDRFTRSESVPLSQFAETKRIIATDDICIKSNNKNEWNCIECESLADKSARESHDLWAISWIDRKSSLIVAIFTAVLRYFERFVWNGCHTGKTHFYCYRLLKWKAGFCDCMSVNFAMSGEEKGIVGLQCILSAPVQVYVVGATRKCRGWAHSKGLWGNRGR